MKILFLGDVMGRAGRRAIADHLPALRTELGADFVIVNGENASGGMGLSDAHARLIYEAGADVITLGDHAFDQKTMHAFSETEPRIIRPINYGKGAPGRGFGIFKTARGKKVLVAQILGQVFMRAPFANPFEAMDQLLKSYKLGGAVDAIFVDFHAETTSEKMAMGIYLDGRISAMIGTHTHVPTADAMILSKGMGFQSDAGMCGDYHSVIGMKSDEPLRRFTTGMSQSRFEPAMGEITLCGALMQLDAKGKCEEFRPIRVGGHLNEAL